MISSAVVLSILTPRSTSLKMTTRWAGLLLLLGGDIETNPGPRGFLGGLTSKPLEIAGNLADTAQQVSSTAIDTVAGAVSQISLADFGFTKEISTRRGLVVCAGDYRSPELSNVHAKVELTPIEYRGEISYSNEDFQLNESEKPWTSFPSAITLAQFSAYAYQDVTTVPIPDKLAGWRLLTSAKDESGYYGAAFQHDENNQIIIAHRGTEPTSAHDLITDVGIVIGKTELCQINAACTFSDKVKQKIKQTGNKIQLFCTGHSLGGWLAQITTFSTKFLENVENKFVRDGTFHEIFHPRTIVFESPGCDGMLDFYIKIHAKNENDIDFKQLDISNYLTVPNLVNTTGKQFGTLFSVYPKKEITLLYLPTPLQHSIDSVVIPQLLKGEYTVIEKWPVLTILPCVQKTLSIIRSALSGEALIKAAECDLKLRGSQFDPREINFRAFTFKEKQILKKDSQLGVILEDQYVKITNDEEANAFLPKLRARALKF